MYRNNSLTVYFIFLLLATGNCLPAKAQSASVTDYLDEVGTYAGIYNGEIETGYNALFYANEPYYISPEFVRGEITFRGRIYPEQSIRLDLFREQIVVTTPGKNNYQVLVNAEGAEEIQIHGKTFIRHTPPPGSGLTEGLYLQLYEGKQLKLLGRVIYETYTSFQHRSKTSFSLNKKYYLVEDGKYYLMKNRRSFAKQYPAFKKQIKKYAREQRLNSQEDPERVLSLLAAYCNELLTQTNE